MANPYNIQKRYLGRVRGNLALLSNPNNFSEKGFDPEMNAMIIRQNLENLAEVLGEVGEWYDSIMAAVNHIVTVRRPCCDLMAFAISTIDGLAIEMGFTNWDEEDFEV